MEGIEEHDIVIVGGGIAGFTTCLALHRMGLRSIVLASWDSLRITGFALTLWTNAWRALDVVGVGDSLRKQSLQMQGFIVASLDSDLPPSESTLDATGKYANHECCYVKRKDLLETILEALPEGSIRFSSKVVSIEKYGLFKLIHLADGAILKSKVLIGCDGVKSVAVKELALQEPVSSGRSTNRGLAELPDCHSFEPKIHVNFGSGVRFGFVPCDEKCVYWFCTFTPSHTNRILQGEELSQAYASGDVFIMPSESETLGNVVLEAMSSGLPVVAAQAGGIPDIIPYDQQDKTSYLFSPGDIDDYLSKLEPLLNNSVLKETIRKVTREEMEKCDWKAATTKIQNENYNDAIRFLRKKRAQPLSTMQWLTSLFQSRMYIVKMTS